MSIDILYLTGIDPYKIGNVLTKDEVELLRIASHGIYQQQGHTLLDFITPDRHRGNYDPLIYGKNIDVNGFKIHKCKIGGKNGRSIQYVKEVQN